MTRLRKDDVEALLAGLDSAMSGPTEEIVILREQLTVALRIVLDDDTAGWAKLIDDAAQRGAWDPERHRMLHEAAAPAPRHDVETTLWALWDLVTELNERRDISPA